MIIPEREKGVKSFRIPKVMFRAIVFFSVITIVIIGILAYDYSKLINQVYKNKHLTIENRQLKEQIELFDRKLNSCVPKRGLVYAYPFFVGNNKSDDSNQSQQPSNGQQTSNGQNGAQTSNGQTSNGQQTGEVYIAADVRKMPGGGYGVYADVFKKGRRVMTPGGKHRKELKKVYKNKKDANDYMAAIMIAKGGG